MVDEEAFASLAVAVGNRLHAVAHRILRDIDLAEDTRATEVAQRLARPPATARSGLEAWSYRLLVRAC